MRPVGGATGEGRALSPLPRPDSSTPPRTKDAAHGLVAAVLRVALVLSLAGAGWTIYKRLPGGGESSPFENGARHAETKLRIVLRRAPDAAGGARAVRAVRIPFQLRSIDTEAAARREFLSEPRRGMQMDEFIESKMGAHARIEGQFDEQGQAVVNVPPGRWRVQATLNDALELTWRLPVNVAGREQTVELTPANVYTKTKSF